MVASRQIPWQAQGQRYGCHRSLGISLNYKRSGQIKIVQSMNKRNRVILSVVVVYMVLFGLSLGMVMRENPDCVSDDVVSLLLIGGVGSMSMALLIVWRGFRRR